MSDARVVALVPVSGRAGQDALCQAAVARLTPAAGRVDVLPAAELVDRARSAASSPGVRVVLVHDPLRAYTPSDVVARVVRAVLTTGRPAVPVLPCSDTVKRLDDADMVIDTPDRADLRVAQSPIGYPAGSIVSGLVVPGTVPAGAVPVAGDPLGRRLAGPVDTVMINGGPA
ncbi:MAG TPA: 2-C-methyl-D-erythritol 4-phosphate cytidylyltransferase [Pseudonocardiaceae bacterium]|nr:2-C-methyl-D-erythritol 4-phosphate cytidylyltransferase [Pseudonocardiaceae bacterium]